MFRPLRPHQLAIDVVIACAAFLLRGLVGFYDPILVVERDSQKGIIIGHKGARLRDVGARARAQIEPLVGTKVFLKLHVRVAKEWQRDPKQLGRLGF